jgi:hypothetical protein
MISLRNNIETIDDNLNVMILHTSKNLKTLRNSVERQHNILRDNTQLSIPSEESYNNSIERYESYKDKSNEYLDFINVAKEKLNKLSEDIVKTQELAKEFGINLNNSRISDLQSLSRKVMDEQVDTTQMNQEENDFMENLNDLQDASRKRRRTDDDNIGGTKLRKKYNKTKIKKSRKKVKHAKKTKKNKKI